MAVKANDLSKAVMDALEEYTDEVQEALQEAEKELANEAVNTLKSTSPKDSGEYARGWTKKKTKKGYVVHNRKYQLTHLLEHGHAKRGGGRVGARVHIKPVEDEIHQKAAETLRKELGHD